MKRRLEWDRAKEASNVAKHGVDFHTASEVFDDPRVVLADDPDHSTDEPRRFAFGYVGNGVLTVRFTMRADVVRIIGAGYWRRGREFYEKENRLYG